MKKRIVLLLSSTLLLTAISACGSNNEQIVENEELQDYLREFNATWFQGYYYSRPISADELLGLLTN